MKFAIKIIMELPEKNIDVRRLIKKKYDEDDDSHCSANETAVSSGVTGYYVCVDNNYKYYDHYLDKSNSTSCRDYIKKVNFMKGYQII